MNEIIDYNNFDKIISTQTNKISASLVTLQFVEHIYNSISVFDKRTNKHLYKTLNEYSKELNDIINVMNELDNNKRYLPKDNYQILLDFCLEHFIHIIKKPKEFIKKEPKMVKLNHLDSVGSRTIRYLSKQPGETIKEKLSHRKNILTDKKRFSYDSKENQCTLYLLNKMCSIAKDRVRNGINNELYYVYDSDIEKSLKKIISLKNNIKNQPIYEAKAKKSAIANNALLSHKNYSVIWKSLNYLSINLSSQTLNERMKNIYDKFISVFQLSLFSKIANMENAFIYDDLFTVKDDKYFTGLYNKEKDLNINDYSVILRDKNTDKNILKLDINKYENSLVIKADFMILNDYYSRFELKDTNSIKLIFIFGDEYIQNRGIPFEIKLKDKIIKGFADAEGLNKSLNELLNVIKKINNFIPYFSEYKKHYNYFEVDRLILDFTSYNPFISLNNMSNKTLKPIVSFNNKYYLYNDSSIYKENNNISSFNSIYDDESSENKSYFEGGLENIKKLYFNNFEKEKNIEVINLMPDSVLEINQSYIKKAIKNKFGSLFYVWRSVAAASYYQRKKNHIKENTKILVVDLLDSSVSAVTLEFTKVKRKNESVNLWKHYPVSIRLDEDNTLSFDNICMKYLELFNKKFNIAKNTNELYFLLQSGIVAKTLLSKRSSLFIFGNDIHLISYDDDIINEILTSAIKFIKGYKGEYYSIIVLANNFYRESIIETQFKNANNVFFYNNGNVASGAYEIYSDWKKYNYSWIEYLPSLSLEVIVNGRYGFLELVNSNQSIEMGKEFENDVKEHLYLPANVQEIKFPLIRDIKNKGNLVYAFIRGNFLPLQNDLEVKLKIKYNYGDENSYTLTAVPINKINAPFEYTVIEFASDDSIIEIEDKPINYNVSSININSSLLEKRIKPLEGAIFFFDKRINDFKLDQFISNINLINIYLSKALYSQNNYMNIILELYNKLYPNISMFKSSSKISQISGLDKNNINIYIQVLHFIFLKFLAVTKNVQYRNNNAVFIKTIYEECRRLWFSTLPNKQKLQSALSKINLKGNNNLYDITKYNIFKQILKYLLHKERDTDNIDIFIDIYNNSEEDDKNKILYHLGIVFSNDNNLLEFILKHNEDFIMNIKNNILNKLKKSAFNLNIVAINIRSYLLILLSFLRLRPYGYFEDLKTGSKKALELSGYIKKIDDNIYNKLYSIYGDSNKIDINKFNEISILKFNMYKGKLYNMCDLTYVANALLTGDDGGNAITVVGVSDDD